MKTTILLIFLFLLFTLNSFCYDISLGVGFGSYSMTDIKKMNTIVVGEITLPVKVTDNFPPYLFYQFIISNQVSEKYSIGMAWAYHSTGFRLTYSDYSGEYTNDELANAISIGAVLEFKLLSFNDFNFFVDVNPGLLFTSLTISEMTRIYDQSQTSKLDIQSTNFYIQPGLKITYPVSIFKLFLFSGYTLDLTGDYHLKGNSDAKLVFPGTENIITSSWDGFRFCLGATINI
jgi:hypothetical protein